MEFWLGVVFGPLLWVGAALLLKWIEDAEKWLHRKWSMRKWNKDEKRKYELEKELEKLNGREY